MPTLNSTFTISCLTSLFISSRLTQRSLSRSEPKGFYNVKHICIYVLTKQTYKTLFTPPLEIRSGKINQKTWEKQILRGMICDITNSFEPVLVQYSAETSGLWNLSLDRLEVLYRRQLNFSWRRVTSHPRGFFSSNLTSLLGVFFSLTAAWYTSL